MPAVPRGNHALSQMGQANPEPASAAATLSPPQKLKRTTLEKETATLLEQYEAVESVLLIETNASTKVLLQRQAEDLLKKYDKIQMQLRQLT